MHNKTMVSYRYAPDKTIIKILIVLYNYYNHIKMKKKQSLLFAEFVKNMFDFSIFITYYCIGIVICYYTYYIIVTQILSERK